jgi:hypothetical protein
MGLVPLDGNRSTRPAKRLDSRLEKVGAEFLDVVGGDRCAPAWRSPFRRRLPEQMRPGRGGASAGSPARPPLRWRKRTPRAGFRPGGGTNGGPVRVVPSDIALLDYLARFLERLGARWRRLPTASKSPSLAFRSKRPSMSSVCSWLTGGVARRPSATRRQSCSPHAPDLDPQLDVGRGGWV